MKAALRLLVALALVAPSFALAQTGTATQPPAPTCRLYANQTIVGYNTKVRLDWSSNNATAGYLTAVGAIAPNGSAYVVPGKNTTYAASFNGPGGTIVCRVAVAVQAGWTAGSGSGSGGGSSSGGTSGGSGTPYSGGVVNINGTAYLKATSIDTSSSISTSGGVPTSSTVSTESWINTNGGINTAGSINISGSYINTSGEISTIANIDTNSSINTNNPVNISGSSINTNAPVRAGDTVNLGGNVTLPTAQSVLPSTQSGGSGFLGGIVPQECRGASTVANCDLCSLAQLGQNVANFLLGLTIPAAALMFAWAGILYFSSRGNPTQIDRAHKIFKTVVIGFVIALSAWVLVVTVMNGLVQGRDFKSWRWDTLNCAETRKARLYNMSLSQYISSSLPGLTSYNPSSTGSAFGESCPQGGTLSVTETGNWCITSNGGYPAADPGGAAGSGIGGSSSGYTLTAAQEDRYTSECAAGNEASCSILEMVGEPTSGVGGRCPSGSVYSEGSCYDPVTDTISDPISPDPSQTGTGDCSPSAMESSWGGSSAAAMSCIVKKESSCNPSLASRSDVGSDGAAFSSGLYQININANYMQCSSFNNGQKVNCPAAFSGKNFNGRVINQELYTQCIEMTNNLPCATENAQRILNTQGYRAWSTAASCGL